MNNTELIARLRAEAEMWQANVESLEAVGCDEIELEVASHKQLIAVLSEAADALEAAQPAGEPDEYQFQYINGKWCNFINEKHRLATAEDGRWPIRALYTHPASQVPMTDDEIKAALSRLGYGGWFDLARAVEAHHKIGVQP